MENLIKIDDFGVPQFQETSIIQFSKFALVFPSGRITPTFSPPFSGLQPISVRLHPRPQLGSGPQSAGSQIAQVDSPDEAR